MNSIVSLPKVKQIFKEILNEPEKMFDLLRIDMRRTCEQVLSELLKAELSNYLGREKYERSKRESQPALSTTSGEESAFDEESLCQVCSSCPEKINYRNGYYKRSYTTKGIGKLSFKVPRDRLGEFNSQLISKYDRYEKKLEKDLVLMFLSGVSTRGIKLISETLIGRKISASEVSNANKELLTGIESWRTRPLQNIKVKYMMVDGVIFRMHVAKQVEKIPMLIGIGVTEDNKRLILCIQEGDKDSASSWREIFKDLKARGLDYLGVQLGVMDGLTGLETVFKEEFPNSKVQRCTVHVSRNVLCKTPKPLKEKVADRLRDIFYAPGKEEALKHYQKLGTLSLLR
jgi:putative transposase